jgi:hypothetical protein
MKIIQLTIIILITITLFSFIKADANFNIIKGLPFADGEKINLYHWASLIIILLTLWGYCRLNRKDEED